MSSQPAPPIKRKKQTKEQKTCSQTATWIHLQKSLKLSIVQVQAYCNMSSLGSWLIRKWFAFFLQEVLCHRTRRKPVIWHQDITSWRSTFACIALGNPAAGTYDGRWSRCYLNIQGAIFGTLGPWCLFCRLKNWKNIFGKARKVPFSLRQLWLVLRVKLMEINRNLFARYSKLDRLGRVKQFESVT